MITLKGVSSSLGISMMGLARAGKPLVAGARITSGPRAEMTWLGKQLAMGDVVFIRIPFQPFTKVATTTGTWTNHVGIVIDVSGREPIIAESRFPLSAKTTWSRFIGRSERGRVAVRSLNISLNQLQRDKLHKAANDRLGVLYDTGFDLHSRRQFCSRYVREVLAEAIGIKVGQIEDFATLLTKNSQADLPFWRAWYFGYIPWQRETVTPASLLRDPKMHSVFDGYVRKQTQDLIQEAEDQ
ncbi:MAG: YebB family permuted papain-like enzyme [Thiobacillaceae bacterium]